MQRYYFDHNATTPVAPEVRDAIVFCLEGSYGNASSIHGFGQDAKARVERARRQVVALLNCTPAEIIFTSGGTEADNLAILGAVRTSHRSRNHVITSSIEHPAVLNTCQELEKGGVEVSYVGVGSEGIVSPDDVRAALKPHTELISIMHANNELGTVQPVAQISEIAREAGVVFHSDGVQSTGKIPTEMEELGVDLFSLSAHKFYGPKGAGALYVRKGTQLEQIQHGGRHERGYRAGTQNVPGIVGLGEAAALARKNLATETGRLTEIRDRFESSILERIESATVNGSATDRVPNTANIRFDGLEGEALVIALDLKGMAVSSGAACSSGAVEPSHVLIAIGLSADQARSSIRFSLGQQNDGQQVGALLDALPEVVQHLRVLSPVYAGAAERS
jgi:cysteine desulfurase